MRHCNPRTTLCVSSAAVGSVVCLDGRVLCVDRSTNTLRWVVEGQVLKTVVVNWS